ncbi:MAG: ABC transporter permease [Deltaproteobacteria bacterium]|nr:ABC transporter permease [Deltaproteobacteria bacterium]
MLGYIAKRIAFMIPMLFGITLISFLLMHMAPGSPTELYTELNPKVGAEFRERFEAYYGLDKPLPVQYVTWLGRVARLDLGISFSPDKRPVWDKIRERLPITLLLNLLSLVLILATAVPLGVISAVRRGSRFDRTTTVLVFAGFSVPSFWLALLLMKWLGVDLGWLPISGLESLGAANLPPLARFWDRVQHLILPVFVSAVGGLAGISRYMRGSMLEVIRQDYVTAARAKGLPEWRVVYVHALRNSLLPIVTLMGFWIPALIGGSVIFETIFAIPGMGQLFYQSVMARDYPVIQGILLLGSGLTLLGNLVADVAYALVDPRIRFGRT